MDMRHIRMPANLPQTFDLKSVKRNAFKSEGKMAKTKSVISRRRFVQSGVAGSVALSTLGLARTAHAQTSKPMCL